MKKYAMVLTAAVIVGGFAACATSQYSSDNMNYYRGQNVPPEFFKVASYTATEITFEIRVKFDESRLYHLVLDGNTPLAEGWFPTFSGLNQSYTVVLEAKPGIEFVPGKAYRLCIGTENPEATNVYSNNYRCAADYEFTLK